MKRKIKRDAKDWNVNLTINYADSDMSSPLVSVNLDIQRTQILLSYSNGQREKQIDLTKELWGYLEKIDEKDNCGESKREEIKEHEIDTKEKSEKDSWFVEDIEEKCELIGVSERVRQNLIVYSTIKEKTEHERWKREEFLLPEYEDERVSMFNEVINDLAEKRGIRSTTILDKLIRQLGLDNAGWNGKEKKSTRIALKHKVERNKRLGNVLEFKEEELDIRLKKLDTLKKGVERSRFLIFSSLGGDRVSGEILKMIFEINKSRDDKDKTMELVNTIIREVSIE
ncbi:MAG: hypothetical protein E7294_03915 [Lachnospiraceae bacterium]|nr:hypothetical protein [Lachnospiraceae bacterium]